METPLLREAGRARQRNQRMNEDEDPLPEGRHRLARSETQTQDAASRVQTRWLRPDDEQVVQCVNHES